MLPNSLSRTFLVRPFGFRPLQSLSRRSSTSPKYEAPGTPQPNKHREFYASYGLPLSKVFLGALLTYQVLYWGWLKLESVEDKAIHDAEISRLEKRVEELRGKDKATKSD